MKILVIGDSCIDVFIYGSCLRLAPEAPVPVFTPKKENRNFGMAGNVSENLKALGATVQLITQDESIIKQRYVEEKSNHLIVRVDSETGVTNNKVDWNNIPFNDFNAVVVSDYNKGYLTHSDLVFISESHPLTFLDTKKVLGNWANKFTFIKINESEWELCEKSGQKKESWTTKLIITLGEKGCEYAGKIYKPQTSVNVADISGAGDTHLAAFTMSYLRTVDVEQSLHYANECAGKVVQQRGVTTI